MKNTLKVAIISPYSTGPIRGNITTVRRISRHLAMLGVEVLELPADIFKPEEMEQHLSLFRPDIINGFHATHCGETACRMATLLGIPSVITITGSDINDTQLRDHPSTLNAIKETSAIICFDELSSNELGRCFPEELSKLHIIPQGVETLPLSGTMPLDIHDEMFMLLLPAALRPVKQIEFPIHALAPLTAQGRNLFLVIAGGVIDEEYATKIRQLLSKAPHAVWLGEVDQEQMGDLYSRADIVLNCSQFEEMPNSLLEAMALARPVLAANIRGNRSLVRHNETGWLYNSEDDFRSQLILLTENRHLLSDAGINGSQFVRSNFSPLIEAKRYLDLYESLVQAQIMAVAL